MKATLPKQCDYCRAIIVIEKKSEVTDKTVDGRRVLSSKCVVCGTNNEINRRRKVFPEIKGFKVDG